LNLASLSEPRSSRLNGADEERFSLAETGRSCAVCSQRRIHLAGVAQRHLDRRQEVGDHPGEDRDDEAGSDERPPRHALTAGLQGRTPPASRAPAHEFMRTRQPRTSAETLSGTTSSRTAATMQERPPDGTPGSVRANTSGVGSDAASPGFGPLCQDGCGPRSGSQQCHRQASGRFESTGGMLQVSPN